MRRVFISYARDASKALAQRIAAGLQEASIDAWRDDERLRGGEPIEDVLREAITTSSAIIFLVTRDWLERPFPRQEAALAAVWSEAHPNVQRVPVLCASDLQTRLPASIEPLRCEKWYDGDGLADDDARLWRILCAVDKSLKIGDEHRWSESWRQHIARLRLGLAATGDGNQSGASTARERISLDCGRDSEWNDILSLCDQQAHAMAVICGPEGEAHEHFLNRIERRLALERSQRPKTVEWVSWWPTPKSREDFLECLAEPLRVETAGLARRISEQLETHDLIFLHAMVEPARGPDRALLEQYYTQWLPELLRESQGVRSMICVQPVAWRMGDGGIQSWLRTLLSKTGKSPADPQAAYDPLIPDDLARKLVIWAKTLPAHIAVSLTPVGDAEVARFCERHQYDAAQRAEILQRAKRSPKGDTSERVLNEIDNCIEELSRRRAMQDAAIGRGEL